jgi:hypothetical protein
MACCSIHLLDTLGQVIIHTIGKHLCSASARSHVIIYTQAYITKVQETFVMYLLPSKCGHMWVIVGRTFLSKKCYVFIHHLYLQ